MQVRGGNRQRPLASEAGQRPPRPPRGLGPPEAALWRELADAVAELGTFKATDLVAFRRMVRCVYRAEVCPLDAAPSASGRLEQAAASALASFGLSPLARQRVVKVMDTRTPGRRILDRLREMDDA
jgi:phage terminase small subunit